MLNSVKFNDTDLYTEFGCYLAHVEIDVPSVQTHFIEIPLRNGSLDVTELLTGDVRYEDRKIKIKLRYIGDEILKVYSDLQNFLHGKRFLVTFDEDAGYFYDGRFAVKKYDRNRTGGGGTFELEGVCNPFKFSIVSSSDDWLWDTFDFEEGYINELSNLEIDGTETIVLIGDEKVSYATVTTDSQMDITYENVTVRVGVGTTTLYDFEFKQGDNNITITGHGTISIDYRGAKL